MEWFLDTSYAIALSARTDHYHTAAVNLAQRIEAQGIRLVTTQAVTTEIGNALAKLRYRKAAIALLDALERDPFIEIIPFSTTLYRQALALYRQRQDKEWGLTDCLSFIVMQERNITQALTADDHFRQAGFRALLLET